MPGDHFFLQSDRTLVTGIIGEDLLEPESPGHRLGLPGTEWLIWRHALLRTTGFPADGLRRLSCPELASVADSGRRG